MSNIVDATPGHALERLINTCLTKLGQSIVKAINREIADIRLAIKLDKAIGVIDDNTADILDNTVQRFASERRLANDRAIAIESQHIRNQALARVPGTYSGSLRKRRFSRE